MWGSEYLVHKQPIFPLANLPVCSRYSSRRDDLLNQTVTFESPSFFYERTHQQKPFGCTLTKSKCAVIKSLKDNFRVFFVHIV